MPFTLAHPAAVLPLRRSGLPTVALVAGSLAPDVPLFLPGVLGSRDEAHSWTHTWLGLGVFCLPVGLLLTLVWTFVLAAPLRDAAPPEIRDRVALPVRGGLRHWALCVPAVLLGSLLHLGWDQFTHEPSWTTEHVPFLAQVVGGLPVARWLMYLCSVLGLAAIGWSMWRGLRGRPPVDTEPLVPSLAPALLPVPVAAGIVAGLYVMLTYGPYMGTHALFYFMLTAGIGVAAAVLLAACLLWHLMSPVGVGRHRAGL